MPKPYDRTTHDGRTVDWLTHAALLECERRLGYPLTIVQGSYHQGVSASAGTHDGGGVVDLAPWHADEKVRVLRSVGFAVWHRATLPGMWHEHVHAVLVGNDLLAPVAGRQVSAYRDGRDGLTGNRPDGTWRPHPLPTFGWPGSDAALALESEVSALLAAKARPAAKKSAKAPGGSLAIRVDGVDLSHHNTVTLAGLMAAHAAGVRFVYHKATEGLAMRDQTYEDRRGLAQQSGLAFGAYHFARPATSNGTRQAEAFLAAAGPTAGDMRCMLDLEDRGALPRAELTAWVGQFVEVVKDRTGKRPVVYTPFDLDDAFDCQLWVARYHPANAAPVVPKPWASWRIRQFSNGQIGVPSHVTGLGRVDLNTITEAPGEPLDWYLLPESATAAGSTTASLQET